MRGKFSTSFVTDYGNNFKKVELNAVYSPDKNTEDNQFSMATPSGKIEMVITNPTALNFIQPGKKYYVDFTEAPE